MYAPAKTIVSIINQVKTLEIKVFRFNAYLHKAQVSQQYIHPLQQTNPVKYATEQIGVIDV